MDTEGDDDSSQGLEPVDEMVIGKHKILIGRSTRCQFNRGGRTAVVASFGGGVREACSLDPEANVPLMWKDAPGIQHLLDFTVKCREIVGSFPHKVIVPERDGMYGLVALWS